MGVNSRVRVTFYCLRLCHFEYTFFSSGLILAIVCQYHVIPKIGST